MAEGFQFDYVFDWTILKYQQSQMATPPTRALVSDPPQWPLVFSTHTVVCFISFSFVISQGPGAGPSSGMPPTATIADKQSGNSLVSSSHLPF